MKFYLCKALTGGFHGSFHADREQFLAFLPQTGGMEEADTIEACDRYVVLAGMFLTDGYGPLLLSQLEQARALGKPILVVRPYGTGYVPAALRPYSDALCDLTAEAVARAMG